MSVFIRGKSKKITMNETRTMQFSMVSKPKGQRKISFRGRLNWLRLIDKEPSLSEEFL